MVGKNKSAILKCKPIDPRAIAS